MDMNMTKTELRAHQIWAVLLLAAMNRQTITYEMLGRFVGGIKPRGFRNMLAVVADYCEKKDYPPLTVIVVGEKSGKPGKKSSLSDDPDEVLQRFQMVFSYNWEKNSRHPSPEDFREIWERIKK